MDILRWGRSAFFFLDESLAKVSLRLFPEQKSLLVFLFHSLITRGAEKNSHLIEPKRLISKEEFGQFIEYFQEQDYRFISPLDILKGNLSPNQKYALITFDDGYANNLQALEILKAHGVPAVFFIATNNVLENKCFWWDVLSRERLRQNVNPQKIRSEKEFLKSKKHEAIEQYLRRAFGATAMTPKGDLDRPMHRREIQALSKVKYAVLGNHTCDHAILTNYPEEEIKNQIGKAQDTLLELTGARPAILSYPDGRYSEDVLRITRQLGIPLGVTTEIGKNRIPLNTVCDSNLRLKRCGLREDRHLLKSCAVIRSEISLYRLFKHFL
jgi:peptidoglycan/xylan/chitin deacetylase (PgdA/CDA1 family)